MAARDTPQTPCSSARLARFAPGLTALLGYRRADLSHDLIAGLSVAAVALPVGVAYAQLAGLSPVAGLYVSILPLVAYAMFGTSRQLIVGPGVRVVHTRDAGRHLGRRHSGDSGGGDPRAAAICADLFPSGPGDSR